MSKAHTFFGGGYTDSSTKESREMKEKDAEKKLKERNKDKLVLNKRGRAVEITSSKEKHRDSGQKLPFQSLLMKFDALRTVGRSCPDICNHSSDRAIEATRIVSGIPYTGGAQVALSLNVEMSTIISSNSGYYLIRGDVVFLHTDGTICIIPSTGMTERCVCGYFHG